MPQVTYSEEMTPAVALADAMIQGLRLIEGIDLGEIRQRFQMDPMIVYGQDIAELTAIGLLEQAETRLWLTARGRLLGNEVFQRLLPD